MPFEIDRTLYARMYGPTVGDRVRRPEGAGTRGRRHGAGIGPAARPGAAPRGSRQQIAFPRHHARETEGHESEVEDDRRHGDGRHQPRPFPSPCEPEGEADAEQPAQLDERARPERAAEPPAPPRAVGVPQRQAREAPASDQRVARPPAAIRGRRPAGSATRRRGRGGC